MLWFDVMINNGWKARVKVVNIKGDMNGLCTYEVKCYQTPILAVTDETVGMKECPDYDFRITHDRRDGMWRLMQLVCERIKELDAKDD